MSHRSIPQVVTPRSSSSAGQRLSQALRVFWQGLRHWCGDADYERYLRSTTSHPATTLLSRREFYLEQLRRRYSRPSRCC